MESVDLSSFFLLSFFFDAVTLSDSRDENTFYKVWARFIDRHFQSGSNARTIGLGLNFAFPVVFRGGERKGEFFARTFLKVTFGATRPPLSSSPPTSPFFFLRGGKLCTLLSAYFCTHDSTIAKERNYSLEGECK